MDAVHSVPRRDVLVARLPDLPAFNRSKRGALVVTPFVFAVRRPLSLTTNDDEVASTMWVPFDRLVRGEGRGTFIWPWEGKTLELPCFHLGDAPGASPFESAAIAAGRARHDRPSLDATSWAGVQGWPKPVADSAISRRSTAAAAP